MKARKVIFIILLIVLADQALKLYIKTNFKLYDEQNIIGRWVYLQFVENSGMAYGWNFGGDWGKLALTVFRMAAVLFGTWYLAKIIREKYHSGFIFCAALVFAGALGNLIDSMFYGMIFEESVTGSVAKIFPAHGYAGFLHGKVVDMLHVHLWGSRDGRGFEFFAPTFNLADASISTGVISILVFQKRFFKQRNNGESHHTVETEALVNDESQVS